MKKEVIVTKNLGNIFYVKEKYEEAIEFYNISKKLD